MCRNGRLGACRTRGRKRHRHASSPRRKDTARAKVCSLDLLCYRSDHRCVGRRFTCVGFVCALALGAGIAAAGQPVPVVPGLLPGGPTSSGFTLIKPGAPVPTLGKCAAAWNRDAPRVTLRWVAARRPARAVIQLPPMIPGQGLCLVSIVLHGNLTLLAQGLWKAGVVHAWYGSAIVTVPPASIRAKRDSATQADRLD